MTSRLFTLFFLFVSVVFAQTGSAPSPFNQEELFYKLKYKKWISANAHFYTTMQKPILDKVNLEILVSTAPLADLLFHINNRYNLTVIKKTWLPLVYSKTIDQKNIQQSFSIKYDHQNNHATTTMKESWTIPDHCFNIFSFFYYLRTLNSNPGDSIKVKMDIESQIWTLIGEATEIKTIDTPWGKKNILEYNFIFTPFSEIKPRKWKTDLFTNRVAAPGSFLKIQIGESATKLPYLIEFGHIKNRIQMILTNRKTN